MVAGAVYHTDIGIVLALLSNMPDKPHGVPIEIKCRTANLGYVFYKKTNATMSRIDLYLLEEGISALDGKFVNLTREVPVLDSDHYSVHGKDYDLSGNNFPHPAELHLDPSPVYKASHIPDVHDVLWQAAGKLEAKMKSTTTRIEIPEIVWMQIRRAVYYDIFEYHEHKKRQKSKPVQGMLKLSTKNGKRHI